LSSASDVWGFVQGAISHAIDEVGEEADGMARGAKILGTIVDVSADIVIDKIKEEIDSSSSEEEIVTVEVVEPVQETP
jgi:hypothetical protein